MSDPLTSIQDRISSVFDETAIDFVHLNKTELHEFYSEGLNSLSFTVKRLQGIKKVASSKNFHLFDSPVEVAFATLDGAPLPIGMIQYETKQLPKIGKVATVSVSYVLPMYQGIGVGMFLYTGLIQHKKRLASDGTLSQHSSAVWAALFKRGYKIQVHVHLADKNAGSLLDVDHFAQVGGHLVPFLKAPNNKIYDLKTLQKEARYRSDINDEDIIFVAHAK